MPNYSISLAETVMRRHPDADSYPYRSWCYPQGFLLWGFIRLYEITGEQKYKGYVMSYCEKHTKSDGSIPAFSGASLDDMMTGSVLIWAYVETGLEKYRKACETVRRAFDGYPRNRDGSFWHGRGLQGELWIDGLYMGLMFLTRYGKYVGDAGYCFAETVAQLTAAFNNCEKDGSGLLYHAWCQDSKARWAHPITGKSPEIWCEGLGWYAMILVEALGLLPENQPGRELLAAQTQKLIEGLRRVQDGASGLWYQVVDKPGYDRNWHDTSGSAMFLYAIKKAGLLGICDAGVCDSIAANAFRGIKTKCLSDLEGNINVYDACDGLCVQMNYDAYVDYAKNVNSKEAVCACFWASIIMEYGIDKLKTL